MVDDAQQTVLLSLARYKSSSTSQQKKKSGQSKSIQFWNINSQGPRHDKMIGGGGGGRSSFGVNYHGTHELAMDVERD